MKNMWMVMLMLVGPTVPLHTDAPATASPDAETSFMVFSDPHYYDPSLGTTGEAFQAYLNRDRKLLKESRDLVLEAVRMAKQSDVEFIIVPGDLTKDGTLVSHSEFAGLMKQVEATGKQVYVVPGNHDVSNGESHAYLGDSVQVVEHVSPRRFEEIYADLGYNEAIYRDSASLSYVVEPTDGLWFLGLDPCLYRENKPGGHPVTDGRFSKETLEWVEQICALAADRQKMLLAFMHHGIIEHYDGQDRFFGDYVVDKYRKVSRRFAELGIRVVFTGHYHSQDITMKKWDDETFIFDVETGSLVTWPCPVRTVTIENDSMFIRSDYITRLPAYEGDFEAYSRQYVHDGIAGIAEETMVDMKLKREDAAKLSGQIGDAFIAHYRGDEINEGQELDLEGVGPMGRFIILFRKKLIKSLYNDLPPGDNDIAISLKDGGHRSL